MSLSTDILKDFAGLVNEKSENSDKKKNTSAYGTAVVSDDKKYVQLDGSDYLTPISEVTEAKDGDRVLVEIKGHRAVVIGNFTDPPSLQASKDADDKAQDALNKVQDAEDAAGRAEDFANNASDKANEAAGLAQESKAASEEAQRLLSEANKEIEKIREEIKDVTVDTDAVRETVREELPAILEETVSAEYAKKTDLVDVKGELESQIRMTAGDLRIEFSEHYVTQSKLVKIEETLNTKINQNSEEIVLSASALTELETDTEDIKNLISAANVKINEAVAIADEAKELLKGAEQDLINADAELTNARENYEEALEYYETVTNRDDVTEQDIYEATNALRDAEIAVDKAKQDFQIACDAVDSAIEDAKTAEEALIQARKDLAEIISSVTDQRTLLKVDAQGAVIENNLIKTFEDNYYDKEEINTKFELEAGNITLEVTKKVEENITVGGTNLCPGTSSDWTEFTLGADYIVIKRFKMEELCEKYSMVDGDNLTYSIQLKSDTGKRLSASWQKYNNSEDRVAEVSENTVIASNGRSVVHPVIDLNYEYLDLMVSNLSENITEDTTEYYRCLQLEKGNVATDWGLTVEESDNSKSNINRNLILDSFEYIHVRENSTSNYLTPYPAFYTSSYGVSLLAKGGEFTMSFDYEITGITTECSFYVALQYKSGHNWRNIGKSISLAVGDNSGHYSYTFIPDDDMKQYGTEWAVSGFGAGNNTDAVIKLTNIKFEKGNKETSWILAPEDTLNDNIDVGGRNLILNSDIYEHVRTDASSNALTPTKALYNSDYGIALISNGGEFTMSFDYEITGITTQCSIYAALQHSSTGYYSCGKTILLTVGDNSGHFTHTFTPNNGMKQYGTAWAISGFGAGNNANAVIKLTNIKFEKGNKETSWTPAPEDVDDSIGSVQDNVNSTNEKLEDVNNQVIETQTKLQLLEGMISTLVTDENGNSLMTQTSAGWQFNISGIQQNVADNADQVAKLQELIGQLSSSTGDLSDAVGNLQNTAEYIWITTYEDEPCIALGESDTSYGLFITNTRIIFVDQSGDPTYISKDGLYTSNLTVGNEFRQGNFFWSVRSNGNYGLMWKEISAESITVVYTGGNVTVGTSLNDLTGITVKVTYTDGTVRTATGYTLSGTIAEGNNTITVTYGTLTSTFIVTGVTNSGGSGGSGTEPDIDPDTASSVKFGYLTIAGDKQVIIYYSDTVTTKDGMVQLTNAKNFVFNAGTTDDTCKLPIGKYVHASGNYATGGDVYYIDPSAIYSIFTETATFTSRNIKYEPAYLITVDNL